MLRRRPSAALADARETRRRAAGARAAPLRQLLDRVGATTPPAAARDREAMLRRQVERRLAALQLASPADYLRWVDAHPDELVQLQRGLLVSASSPFRDAVFAALRKTLAAALAARPHGAPLRVWVAGCAGGAEAYSIGMIAAEILGERLSQCGVRIFATDGDGAALAAARAALYPEEVLDGLEAQWRERYFVAEGSARRVIGPIRALCVFARHDLVRQAPFERLDLISCRNVLGRFEPDLQREILAHFHGALDGEGLLLLGRGESAAAAGRLFAAAGRGTGLYRPRRGTAAKPARTAPGRELEATREHLHTVVEQLESSHRELRDGNDALRARAAELAVLNETLSRIYNSMPIGLVHVDAGGLVRRFNRLAEIRGALRLPDLQRQLEQIMRGGEPLVWRSDAGDRHYLVQIAPDLDEAGRYAGAILSFTDISTIRRLEIEGEEAEERFRLFMDNGPGVAWIKDEAGRLVYLSASFEKHFRIRRADWLGKTDFEVWPAEFARAYRQNDLSALAAGKPHEAFEETPLPDGRRQQWRSFRIPFRDAAGRDYVGGIGIDVTGQHLADLALRESEARFRATFEQAAVGAAHIAPDGRWLLVNRRLCDMLGYDRDELLALRYQDITYRDDMDSDVVWVWKMLAGQISNYSIEKRYVRKNGSPVWVDINVALVWQSNGQPDYFIAVVQDISDRKRAEAALQESEARQRVALDAAELGTWRHDIDADLLDVDVRSRQHFGFATGERASIAGIVARAHPDDRLRVSDAMAAERRPEDDNDIVAIEYRVLHADGAERWLAVRARILYAGQAAGRRPTVVIGTSRDITARKRRESDLGISAVALESRAGIVITDAQGRIQRVNEGFTAVTGYAPEEALGRSPAMLKSGRHDQSFYDAMWAEIDGRGQWQGEIWNQRKNGEIYPERLTINAVRGADDKVANYVGVFEDITERKAAEEQIRTLAFYDALTGLPNRRLLMDRLHQGIAQGHRNGSRGALLFIDLDNFKVLNDTLGHDAGDSVLVETARRLQSSVRDGDTVARLGGDEFIVMLEDLAGEATEAAALAKLVAEKIIVVLDRPYPVAGGEHHSTPSIGITLFGEHDEAPDKLLKQADLAMYEAKAAGRNTVRFFDPQMQAVIEKRSSLEAALRVALRHNQFELRYQPQVDRLGRLVGVEALINWQETPGDVVSPAEFIPTAEDSGLIVPIGAWVLERAGELLRQWAGHPATADLTVAVNISARQFRDRDFAATIATLLAAAGGKPNRLRLELAEPVLVQNIDLTIAKMTAVRAVGATFSLDDFGTGHSSLPHLNRLPLDQLKIDRSFILGLVGNDNQEAIVRAIISLARSLGLKVIAEGVEAQEQWDFLLTEGCDAGQGFLFGRPLPIAALEAEWALRDERP